MVPSGSASPVGLFGLHSQMTAASRPAARTAGASIAKPRSGPRRGTVTTRAPRCSVRTRNIAYDGVGTTAVPPAGRNVLAMTSRTSSAPAPTSSPSGATP